MLTAPRTYEGGELDIVAVVTLGLDLLEECFGAPAIVLCPKRIGLERQLQRIRCPNPFCWEEAKFFATAASPAEPGGSLMARVYECRAASRPSSARLATVSRVSCRSSPGYTIFGNDQDRLCR